MRSRPPQNAGVVLGTQGRHYDFLSSRSVRWSDAGPMRGSRLPAERRNGRRRQWGCSQAARVDAGLRGGIGGDDDASGGLHRRAVFHDRLVAPAVARKHAQRTGLRREATCEPCAWWCFLRRWRELGGCSAQPRTTASRGCCSLRCAAILPASMSSYQSAWCSLAQPSSTSPSRIAR